jgi:hypothetical protein
MIVASCIAADHKVVYSICTMALGFVILSTKGLRMGIGADVTDRGNMTMESRVCYGKFENKMTTPVTEEWVGTC